MFDKTYSIKKILILVVSSLIVNANGAKLEKNCAKVKMIGGDTDDEGTKEMLETMKGIVKPPVMITDGHQFPLHEERLYRWSRLCPPTKQHQFNLILNGIDPTNPLSEKLEEDVGESKDAKTNGVAMTLEELKDWFGEEEDIDAFINYKEFEGETRDIWFP